MAAAVAPAQERLPAWREDGEKAGHRQYILHYRTTRCPRAAQGCCSEPRAPRSSQRCFCFHAEATRRRPLVDTRTGQVRYWDVMCGFLAERGHCPSGDACPFAHTREEISYHAAKYKTKLCNDADCRGEDVCCFAHREAELRVRAPSRYSYRTLVGDIPKITPKGHWPLDVPAPFVPTALAPDEHGHVLLGAARGGPAALPCHGVYRHRFCASYPNIADCRRGESCAFAHSREEIRVPLLSVGEEEQRPEALTSDFFVYRFKTHWCPVGVQHDWQNCVYAHNYQDARRHPSIGYGPRPCPYWKRQETSLEYSQRCPLGVRCPYSHGAKEQLYHPAYFKTVACQDPPATCPRGTLCAFWHKRSQQRGRATSKEKFNYKAPLTEEQTQANLQLDFLTPPFKLLSAAQELDAWALQPYAFHDAGALEPGSLLPGELGPDGAGTPAARTTAPDSDGASAAPTPGSDAALAAPQDASWSGGMAAQPWVPQMICYVPMPFAGSMLVEGHVAMVGAEDGWLPGAHQQLTLPGPVPGCAAALPQGLAGGRRDDYSDSEDGLSAEKLPGSATETTTDSPRDERMPSLHGFIHFKDAELDSPRAPCRPRANSH